MFLGVVERAVGIGKQQAPQRFLAARAAAQLRHANADAGMAMPGGQFNRAHLAQDPVGQRRGLLLVGMRAQDAELFATVAPGHVRGAARVVQRMRDLAQHASPAWWPKVSLTCLK